MVFAFYRILLLLKFVAVLAFAGGFAGAFLSGSMIERKRAVHAVASPALFVIWVVGYLLTTQLQIALTELWILGALVFSTLAMGALTHGVSKPQRSLGMFLAAAIPLLVVLWLMVFRPTWATLRVR